MKKRVFFLLKRVTMILLPAVLLLSSAPQGLAVEADPLLRIGLLYGSAALPAVNLENHTGSGYRFGYLDGTSFNQLGSTGETKITMVKNRNIYMKNSLYYDADPPEGSTLIGAYHIDLGRTYDSAASAESAAAELSARGVGGFVSYSDGAWYVRGGSYNSSAGAQAAIDSLGLSGAKPVTGSAYCVTVVQTNSGKILWQFDGGSFRSLVVYPSRGEVSAPVTWFKGYRYYGMFEYRRLDGNNITVIGRVSMQDYLKGVIPYEMSPSWPLEALKAQALCAKSYAACNMNKHRNAGFDLCNTTDCQVYYGVSGAGANSDRAVDETYGLYIFHNGAVANTFYHASNGGSTEDAVNVWSTDLPYLKAVPDNFENLARAAYGIWQTTYTNEQITQILREKGYNNGPIVSAYVDQFTPSGNVYRLTFVDSSGKKYNFEKEKARLILNSPTLKLYTYSQRFAVSGSSTMTVKGQGGAVTTTESLGGVYAIGAGGLQQMTGSLSDVKIRTASGVVSLPSQTDGVYVFSGRGHGHNVGMSQEGARGMAEQGYTASQIVEYYFTGTVVSQ